MFCVMVEKENAGHFSFLFFCYKKENVWPGLFGQNQNAGVQRGKA